MRKILLLLALCGCGGEDDPKCSKDDRRGTYLVKFTTESGDCGEQTDALIRMDVGGDPGDGCTIDYNDFSGDECRLESGGSCDLPGDDLRLASVMVSEQENSSGSHITGTMSLSASTISTGSYVCNGVYSFDAKRQ